MTRYQKNWIFGFLVIFSTIIFSLFYAALKSENSQDLKHKINNLNVDQIDAIYIIPSNPNWRINLSLDTIKITQKAVLDSTVNIIKTIDINYSGRASGGEWQARMMIKYNNNDVINLILRDSEDGFFIEFTNSMGRQLYYCPDLKRYLELLANYTEPVGG